MKSFLLSISMVLMAVMAGAQQLHFVYLQTDSRKPFYVMLNNKNYSSTSIGYVILPKLQNGEYAVKIGFPRSEQAEQEFLLQVKDNDQGFLVKDFGDKGWGLFNTQSLDIQYAGSLAQKRTEQLARQKAETEAKQKAAAAQLALENQRKTDSLQAIAQQQAYTDSVVKAEAALQQQPNNTQTQTSTATVDQQHYQDSIALVKSQEQAAALAQQQAADKKRTDSLQAAAATTQQVQEEIAQRHITDSLNKAQATALENERLERLADSTARAQAVALENAKQADNNTENRNKSTKLLRKNFTDSGWRYTYVINNGSSKENVDVFIPVGQPETAIVATPIAKKSETATRPETNSIPQTNTVATPTKTAGTTNTDTQFLDMTFGANTGSNTVVKTDSTGVKVLHNSNCRAMADEKDFTNIRKKIVAADATDKMINVARKYMKEKCFTTDQIRNLSYLFLTDADRYQFLDTAYPFTVDAYRFSSLQDLLKDDYYLQRFKAMIR